MTPREQRLDDSQVLLRLAQIVGITLPQARELVAQLAELPARQAFRICVTAQIKTQKRIP